MDYAETPLMASPSPTLAPFRSVKTHQTGPTSVVKVSRQASIAYPGVHATLAHAQPHN